MISITSNVSKSTKQLVQDTARKMAGEPLEILKQGGKQLVGTETQRDKNPQIGKRSVSGESDQNVDIQKAKMEAQGKRQLAALEAEIRDIRAKEAQREQVEREQEMQAEENKETPKPLVEPAPKQGRRLAGMPGQQGHLKRQQTHVERVQPPSG